MLSWRPAGTCADRRRPKQKASAEVPARAEVSRQVTESGRARGIAAAIEGYFAAAWFGWAMASAGPPLLTLVLQIGIGLAILVVIAGIVLAVRSPAQSTPMRDRTVRRRYGIVVGLEFALLGAGAAALAISGLAKWIPVWICTGVGIHFIPLSRVLGERSLVILGVLISAVALAALITGLTSAVAPGTVTGAGAGLCLLVSAAITLIARRLYTGRIS
jgi:hypothetical protein